MTAPDARPELDRADLIDALSWAEDMQRGRWGTQYATAVLDAHDARVHDALLTENAELKTENVGLKAFATTAHGTEAWASAMTELQRLRDQVADLEFKLADLRILEDAGDAAELRRAIAEDTGERFSSAELLGEE